MSQLTKYLCFDLGKEEFAIPLLSVKEVLAYPETTPIPQAPTYFVGILNLRGSVISVLDLRAKLGYKAQRTEESSVIIMDFGGFNLGVVVDRVNSVAAFSTDELSAPPEIEAGKATEFITGVFRKGNRLVILLELAKALSVEDRIIANSKTERKSA